jgi:hypothetical protein
VRLAVSMQSQVVLPGDIPLSAREPQLARHYIVFTIL